MSDSVTVARVTPAEVSQVGACLRGFASNRLAGRPVYEGVNRSFIVGQIVTRWPGLSRAVVDYALDVLTAQQKIVLVKGPFGLITLWQL